MSMQESGIELEHAEPAGDDGQTAEPEIHPGYDPVDRLDPDDAHDAAAAWVDGTYPTETDGRIMIEDEHHVFVQNPDGSGFVDHGGDNGPCAVRSADGRALVNQSHDRDCARAVHGAIERALIDSEMEWDPRPFEFYIDVLDFALDDPDPDAFFQHLTEIDVYEVDRQAVRNGETTDSDGMLMVNRERDQRLFVGRDWTATRHGSQVFGFVPDEDTPCPSARDAIELLKPDEVAAAQAEGKNVVRQGEWFLVEMTDKPNGAIQRPGVGSRPYGASPLDSHIPTEWAPLVEDHIFLDRFSQVAAYRSELADAEPETPQEAVEAVRENMIDNDDFAGMGWFDMLTMMAGAVCVRGTFRHRRNEHFMESVEGWHRAYTHDYDVLVADEANDYVRID